MQLRSAQEAFEQLDREARRQLDGIRRQFMPLIGGAAVPRPSDLGLQLALALADVTELRDSLRQCQDLIAAELRQHNSAQSAMAAYSKSTSAKARRVC